MAKVDKAMLLGGWLHAVEEDEPGESVFRPASYQLPPARGRTGYEFHADGRVTRIGSGPTDRTATAQGQWKIDSQGRIAIDVPGHAAEIFEILTQTKDRLVVKK